MLERVEATAAIEPAVLLVSEVVTNAVLHAGTPITVTVGSDGTTVRVDVADGSTALPAPKGYETDAATGRGLELVAALSSAWGVERRRDGKCVWFEVALEPGTEADRRGEVNLGVSSADGDVDGPGDVITVHFPSLPVELVWAVVKYGDALLRESVLLALGGDREVGDAADWSATFIDLEPLLAEIRTARSQGLTKADLTCRFAADAAAQALHRLALINEADRLAGEGKLLLPPALPEVADCRRWMLGEIIRQAQGTAPSAWRPEFTSSPAEIDLPADLRSRLEAMAGGVLGADSANRIVYASAEAAALLGWDPQDLVGHRLTVIVPPELREKHLAGYTRYQVTHAPVLVGSPVTVPALRHDGTTIDVELLITAIGGPRGVFAAAMKPA